MYYKCVKTLIHLFSECRQIWPFWEWISRELRLTIEVGRKLVYLNNFDNVEKMYFLSTIVAKSTIWELRGILRKVRLPDVINSLKINFKYKLLTQLITICQIYNSRNQLYLFDQEYTVKDKIVREASNNVTLNLIS